MTLVTVTVLVTVKRKQQEPGPGCLDSPVNPTDLADLMDLVASKKSYLYIKSEQHQIVVMQRPLTATAK